MIRSLINSFSIAFYNKQISHVTFFTVFNDRYSLDKIKIQRFYIYDKWFIYINHFIDAFKMPFSRFSMTKFSTAKEDYQCWVQKNFLYYALGSNILIKYWVSRQQEIGSQAGCWTTYGELTLWPTGKHYSGHLTKMAFFSKKYIMSDCISS